MTIEVLAIFSRMVFAAHDASYSVVELVESKSARRFRATGKIAFPEKCAENQFFRFFGEWQTHAKYGQTFSVVYYEVVRPDNIDGIIPFLAQNVKGVGEITAKKLINSLSVKNIDDLLAICKDQPELIHDFFKARKSMSETVIAVITGNEIYRSIMIFLHEHNIPSVFAQKIYEKYGKMAIELLTENPYRLIRDFPNVGFVRADAIAQKLGIESTSIFRIEAAFAYSLQRSEDDGHCCLPRDILVQQCAEILGGKNDTTFSFDYVLQQMRGIYKRFQVLDSPPFLLRQVTKEDMPSIQQEKEVFFYLPETFATENKVAMRCLELIRSQEIGESKVENALTNDPEKLKSLVTDVPWDKLSDEQFAAVVTSISSRFMILTGGPGCGKTFVLKAINAVQKTLKRKIALCAPTGLAAKRMTASIGEQACTIHKLLGLGRSEHRMVESEAADKLEDVDVVIIDEASMLGLDLFALLLDALDLNRRLILVGDIDQLPSVNAGNCLRDIINSQTIPVCRLTKIFRQSSQSHIPLAAREIIQGIKPNLPLLDIRLHPLQKIDLQFLECTPADFANILVPLVRDLVPEVFNCDPLKAMQIIVPMKKGEVGQDKINILLQEAINAPNKNKKECSLPKGGILREGDKVIQTKNNYLKDVFNGDLGFCKSIELSKNSIVVEIEFDDRLVKLEDEELEDIQLAYAMTVHKSQGSEFPLVILPLFTQHYVMLDRNLLYTAITRASKSVIFIGSEWALKKSVKTESSVKRYTCLEALLKSRGVSRIMTPT